MWVTIGWYSNVACSLVKVQFTNSTSISTILPYARDSVLLESKMKTLNISLELWIFPNKIMDFKNLNLL